MKPSLPSPSITTVPSHEGDNPRYYSERQLTNFGDATRYMALSEAATICFEQAEVYNAMLLRESLGSEARDCLHKLRNAADDMKDKIRELRDQK